MIDIFQVGTPQSRRDPFFAVLDLTSPNLPRNFTHLRRHLCCKARTITVLVCFKILILCRRRRKNQHIPMSRRREHLLGWMVSRWRQPSINKQFPGILPSISPLCVSVSRWGWTGLLILKFLTVLSTVVGSDYGERATDWGWGLSNSAANFLKCLSLTPHF